MKEIDKIANPFFLLSLVLLIMNDWLFKSAFHNEITGKLSDFAGLFAFSFLGSILFSANKKAIHLLAGIIFVYWNSGFSQPLIDFLNSVGLPVVRTIDVTDNIALVSILLSYKCLDHSFSYRLKPVFQKLLIGVSCLAFVATTLPPRENRKYVDVGKEYQFDFSKRELVSRLNMVQLKTVRSINKASGQVDFDAETNVFYFYGRSDTLALMLDYNEMEDQDTIEFKTSFAEIMISGNEENSKLKLLTVYKVVPKFKDVNYREKAIRQFEKQIIKKIRKYR